jgi:hypothetical protein
MVSLARPALIARADIRRCFKFGHYLASLIVDQHHEQYPDRVGVGFSQIDLDLSHPQYCNDVLILFTFHLVMAG